jgi:hypothetical protein
MDITVNLTLSPVQAAGLKRFAEKVTHDDALAVLYPHVAPELRSDQAYTILNAFARLESDLADAGVRSWPWIETGSVS